MIEFDLKESVPTSVLGRLIDTLNSTDNIVDIFSEAKKQLSIAVKCDDVNILLNNQKARYFYINYVLNQKNVDQGHDVIIPYSETSITEILNFHRSIIRNDLSGRGKLTPGDKKFLAEDTKSDLSVPIINKNRVLAIINLSSYQSNYFTEKHQAQTEPIASLLALAFERSELIEKLNQKQNDLLFWKNKFNSLINNTTESIAIIRQGYDLIDERIQLQLSVINEINKLANSELEIHAIIQFALIAIKKIVSFDYAQIALIDDSEENVESHTIISDRCRKFDEQNNWNILEKLESYWFNFSRRDLHDQIDTNGNYTNKIEEKLRSRVSAVLMAQNRYIGTLAIGNLEPDSLQKCQIKFVQQIAQQIGLVIESVRLTQACKERLIDDLIQAELNEMIGVDLNIKNVLLNIVALSIERTKAELATIHFLENDGTVPEITVSDPDVDEKELIDFEKENVIPAILKSRNTFIIDDFFEKYLSQDNSLNGSLNSCRTYLAILLKLKDTIIGTLTLYWNKPISLDSNELRLAKMITTHASAAIENAKRYQEKIDHCEQLEKANTELENLFYFVFHDLKTPLASIQGFNSILLDNLRDEINDEAYKYLERIRGNALKIQRLINDLLEFSRIGRVVETFNETDMAELIYRARNELIYIIKRKKIKLIIDKNMPKVYCEGRCIEQVFINLIDNAIKYIGENNKRPRIRIGYKNGNETDVFFVQDNGVGIGKEFHEHVFELFYGINDGKDDEKGSGIGLAIVKKIIENHHGKIWLESEEGKGSTFYFTLPKRKI